MSPSPRLSLTIASLAAAALLALPLAGCGDAGSTDLTTGTNATSTLPTGSQPVKLDPADFTTEITNPYWSMAPGDRWVYSEAEDGKKLHVVVTVTDQTKRIANGVEARVVHDVVSDGGEPVEVTDDWYAQDGDGNLWYLGEQTAEYENGKVSSREGSFEAGVDGALPGVALPGDPQPGLTYRQEFKRGEAQDFATVLSLDGDATVPAGSFSSMLKTEDVNPLQEPKQVENKFYAKGTGPVLTIDTGTGGREELISYTPG